MQRLVGRAVFTVGARDYRWDDVLLAAHMWGEGAELERRTREGLSRQKQMEAAGDSVSDQEAEEAADRWRYEHDLLSADDMRAWLSERDLDMDEWLEYIERLVSRQRAADKRGPTKSPKVSSGEVDAVIYAEAVCSGQLGALAGRLAGHAAIFDRASEESTSRRAFGCSKAEIRAFMRRLPSSVRRAGLLGTSAHASVERAEFLACVTLTFDRFIDRIAAPAAIKREIEAHELEWTRIDCQKVRFEAEETAREAALLVREDGLDLEKAAAAANAPVEKTQYVLEDVLPPLKDRLVAVHPGELIGPLSDDGYVLISVLDRVRPSTRDATTRRRAKARVVERAIEREVNKRVRWHERF